MSWSNAQWTDIENSRNDWNPVLCFDFCVCEDDTKKGGYIFKKPMIRLIKYLSEYPFL